MHLCCNKQNGLNAQNNKINIKTIVTTPEHAGVPVRELSDVPFSIVSKIIIPQISYLNLIHFRQSLYCHEKSSLGSKIEKVKLFRHFYLILKHKQIILNVRKLYVTFLGYFFPFLNNVIINLHHENIGFISI